MLGSEEVEPEEIGVEPVIMVARRRGGVMKRRVVVVNCMGVLWVCD